MSNGKDKNEQGQEGIRRELAVKQERVKPWPDPPIETGSPNQRQGSSSDGESGQQQPNN